jgi:hypothetical protein
VSQFELLPHYFRVVLSVLRLVCGMDEPQFESRSVQDSFSSPDTSIPAVGPTKLLPQWAVAFFSEG